MRSGHLLSAVVLGLGLAALLLLLVAPPTSVARASPDIYYVREGAAGDCLSATTPCGSVQHAINLAGDGDEVWVATGTYTENLAVTHSVKLRGGWDASFTVQSPSSTPTILDGRAQHNVRVEDAPLAEVTLEGLTLRNGGDGVHVWTGDVTVERCTVLDAARQGFEIDGGTVLISATHILTAQQGIKIDDGAVQVAGVHIAHTREEGLRIEGGGTVTFTGSTIEDCQQQGVQVDQGSLWLFDNTIHGVISDGIRIEGGAASIISNIVRAVAAHPDEDYHGIEIAGNQVVSGNLVVDTDDHGIYAHHGAPTIVNNVVHDTGGDGIHTTDTSTGVEIRGNTVYNADKDGIDTRGQNAVVASNVVHTTGKDGIRAGGASTAQIQHNAIYDADDDCIEAGGDTVLIADNLINGCRDQGIKAQGVNHSIINANRVYNANQDHNANAAGIDLDGAGSFTVTNNIVAASGWASVLVETAAGPHSVLYHNTLVGSAAGQQGTGVNVDVAGVTITLANNIVVSHSVGIRATAGATMVVSHTLLWGNGSDPVSGAAAIHAPPLFVAPAQRDYHLLPSSPAVDAGVDVGVTGDMDGDPRPIGALPDVGADETGILVTKHARPIPVQPGAPLTYTIHITNVSKVTLTATITDVLPNHVSPPGTLAWTPDPIAPGGAWTETVAVTVEVGYIGPLTNVVQVTTGEGATGVYTHTLAPDLEVTKQAHPDPVQVGESLSYTIALTNTGAFVLHATVTDTLPDHVTPTGTFIRALDPITPGDTWSETVAVAVEVDYAGPLTNVVEATSDEGATGVYTETSTVVKYYPVYLPLVVRSYQLESPTSHSAEWWTAVQEDLRSREYQVTWQASPLIPGGPAGYQAPNRAHNLRIGFYSTGIRAVERTATGPTWTWGLSLTGSGQKDTLTSIDTPVLSVRGNHVTYQRGPLTEWYTNDENGLEQGFEISKPKAQSPKPKSRIVLELALTGDLIPHLTDDGRAIEFTAASGPSPGRGGRTPVLRYGPPRATDATGRQLPTDLELIPTHHATRNTSHASRSTPYAIRITIADSSATYPITLRLSISALPSSADWIGESDQAYAHLGYAISTAGDVNGDGYSDLIVGAPRYDGGQTDEGAAFVYHGSSVGLGSTPAWSAEGDQPDAHFGAAVSVAGDVNGDGFADVLIGAPDYDGSQPDGGVAFVYYGSANGLTEGSADWAETGDQAAARLGASVSTAGDVNGDGYADILVGAPGYDGDHPDEGAAFAYRGSASGLTEGPADWAQAGEQEDAQFGTAVSAAGDVDGDGYADVVVGAPGYDVAGTPTMTDAGRAGVYYGSSTGLTTGWSACPATGDQAYARLGASVSTAGDVDGDGYADVIVGAPGYDGDQTDEGAALAYHGGPDGLATTPKWTIHPTDQADAHFGAAVSVAGDVNSDGYADVVVGAPDSAGVQPDEGAAFVYHGGPGGLSTTCAWSSHPTEQAGAHFGAAVATAGDANGDGHSDLAIGAPGYYGGQTDEGGAFVYHGSPSGLAAVSAWSATGEQDSALLGWSVSTAGDVNGDGYADVIVGAPKYDHGQTEEGVAFVYAGGPDGPATSPAWMGESDQAWAWFGTAVATAGDVNNDGYDDVIVGAPRYDGEQRDEGAAFVYHGGPTGLITTTTWLAHPTDQADARFGTAVSTAGDVNGDGFADVIVTANGYDAEARNEGAAFVYHGGPTSLAADPAWAVHPTDQAYANFGRSASTAGDVNRDGYSDVVIGAPWYDAGEAEEDWDKGTAFVYHGSATGLSPDPDRTATGERREAKFGIAVATAGDVNNDGYSDVIVGAYQYTELRDVTPYREGAAFVYHGGATGLTADAADWMVTGSQEEAKFGLAVSTAGDVNGDGHADVVVGAPNYADGEPHEGAAFVYHGGPGGLDTSPAWSVEGDQVGAGYGFAVSTAGDVDGDGYSDLIVGAPTYNRTEIDEGAAFVYLGNGGGGLAVRPQQVRADRSAPIARLGRSDSSRQVGLRLTARSPLGRAPVGLQWQLAPLGTPFTAATAISGTSPGWSDVLTAGVALSQTVDGLTGDTVYRWRMRLLYPPGNPLGQGGSRWLYLPWNGPQEADFRTPRLLAPDRSANAPPGSAAVYTHTLTNPISQTQAFTLTAASSQGYTVTVATPSGGPTVTLPGRENSPVTVTVRVPSTAIGGTRDTTVVTATSELSGQDVVYDVTTVGPATAPARPRHWFLPIILRGLPQR